MLDWMLDKVTGFGVSREVRRVEKRAEAVRKEMRRRGIDPESLLPDEHEKVFRRIEKDLGFEK